MAHHTPAFSSLSPALTLVGAVRVDIGVTFLEAVLLDDRGEILPETVAPTTLPDANMLVRTIAGLSRELQAETAGAIRVAAVFSGFADRPH